MNVQREMHPVKKTDRQTKRQTDRQTHRKKEICRTDKKTDRRIDTLTDVWKDPQADGRSNFRLIDEGIVNLSGDEVMMRKSIWAWSRKKEVREG